MIKTKEGTTEISGTTAEVLADLTSIIKALMESTGGKISRDDIDECVKIAFMSDEEKAELLRERFEKMDSVLSGLKSIMEIIGEAKNQMNPDENLDETDFVAMMDKNLMRDIFGEENSKKKGVV